FFHDLCSLGGFGFNRFRVFNNLKSGQNNFAIYLKLNDFIVILVNIFYIHSLNFLEIIKFIILQRNLLPSQLISIQPFIFFDLFASFPISLLSAVYFLPFTFLLGGGIRLLSVILIRHLRTRIFLKTFFVGSN